MVNYIHIGYPKNFSTSLQRNLFSRHKDLYHLGIGVGSNINYRDDLLASLFEVYLKTTKRFKYQEVENRLKAHITEHKRKADEAGAKAFGVSSEHFSFSFTYECLDFHEKMKRAIELFGSDTKIIMIMREQLSLIRSLYKESVRVGLPMTYHEFLYNLHKFQDRNYYYDLRYDLVAEALADFVGLDNVHFLTFEDYREASGKLLVSDQGRVRVVEDICKALGVDYLESDFLHYNEALSNDVVRVKAELNKTTRHDLGNNLYSSAELHRQASYFSSELGVIEEESEAFKDVLTKRALMEKATAEADGAGNASLFQVESDVEKEIVTFYKKGNARFKEITGIDLPSSYF